MPNMEFVRVIFIYHNVFKFHVPKSISFLVFAQKHMHTEHTDTHRPPDAQKDSDEYSICACCKNATIIIIMHLLTSSNVVS